jgi:hypothetical protein
VFLCVTQIGNFDNLEFWHIVGVRYFSKEHSFIMYLKEELDGLAVSALGMQQSRKLSNLSKGQDTYIPLTLNLRRGSRDISGIPLRHPNDYQNDLVMRNTADVTGGKLIAV